MLRSKWLFKEGSSICKLLEPEGWGAGGELPSLPPLQILTDHLTLSQAGGGGGEIINPSPLLLIKCCALRDVVPINSKILEFFTYHPNLL